MAHPYATHPGPHLAQGGHPVGPTVLGVPLMQGERVVYFHRPRYTADKVAYWALFAVTVWFLIGFVFLYLALTVEKKNPRGQVVTTQRVIQIPGDPSQPILSVPLQNIGDLEPVRQSAGGGGGGLLGAAIRAGVTAVANNMADRRAKTEASYWARASAVVLVDHGGIRTSIASKDAVTLGVFLANGMLHGGFGGHADVRFDP